jgi:hypothetical protein
MKVLFTLMLIVGFGFWLTQEIQHEKELQTQLDETRKSLDEAQKRLQALQPQQNQGFQQRNGFGANAQWTNPLDAPPVRAGRQGSK